MKIRDSFVNFFEINFTLFSFNALSLNANYSFKYFGQEKGVSVYSFIDERHLLFYSTVISSSEREAAYVIDGLLHNETLKSDIHSTDSHGFIEVVTKIIEENWDSILRFVATIKLKRTTASQLFKRLNSYSNQHPLYQALKEFGKIIKTLFILRYIDDVELRQSIEKQLSKLNNHKNSPKPLLSATIKNFPKAINRCRTSLPIAAICSKIWLSAGTTYIYNAKADRIYRQK